MPCALAWLLWPTAAVLPAVSAEEAASSRFAVFSDPQIRVGKGDWDHVFRTILEDISRHRPRPGFLIIVGDLVDGRSGGKVNRLCPPEQYDPQYRRFFEILREHLDPAIAFYPVAGNHEYHRDKDGAVRSGAQKYAEYMLPIVPENALPRGTPYYSFDYGNSHFAVIATGLLGYREDWQDLVYGDQYEWLRGDLAAAAARPGTRHVFVFGHHQMYPLVNGLGARKELPVLQERIWKPLFVRYGVDAYIHGHWHFYDRSTHEGVAMIDVAGADGREDAGYPQQNPNHYAILDVGERDTRVSIHLLGGELYESYSLNDLRAGRLPPPHIALRNRYGELFETSLSAKPLFAAGVPARPPRAAAGTVLLHHFDAVEGYTLRDASGRGNHIPLRPGVTLVPAKFGEGCRLDGQEGYLETPIRGMPGVRGRLSAWVSFDALDHRQTLFRVSQGATGLKLDLTVGENSPSLRLSLYDARTSSWARIKARVTEWGPGQWHHVQASWDRGTRTMQLFLDGELAVSGPFYAEPDFSQARQAWIGCDNDLSDRFSGVLDDLVIDTGIR